MTLQKALRVAALLVPCAAGPALAQPASLSNTSNHPWVLTAGVITLVLPPPPPQFPRTYERLINVGASGVAWCSRFSTTPGPNSPGSFPLAPFGNALQQPSLEEFYGSFVPQQPLYCTAASGTATLTGETAP